MPRELSVVAIKGAHRTHPIPSLSNFKITTWDDEQSIRNAHVYLQTNISGKDRSTWPIYSFIKTSKKPYLVTEAPVFRKNMSGKNYHRWSWFSYFQDKGNYNNQNCPSDRWEQIKKDQGITVKDWRTTGEHILFLMQRPGDTSTIPMLEKYGTYQNFLNTILKQIRNYTRRPIIIRMHPLRRDQQHTILKTVDLQGAKISENNFGSGKLDGGAGLEEDFKNAWAVIGYNTNALTESVCEGIPTFSLCPSSMAWDVSNTDLRDLEDPQIFDREQWLYNLSYCQWKEDEIARGDPWFHLKQIYNEVLEQCQQTG